MPVSLEKEETTPVQLRILEQALAKMAENFQSMAQAIREFYVPPARTFSLGIGPVISSEMTGDPFFPGRDAARWRPE